MMKWDDTAEYPVYFNEKLKRAIIREPRTYLVRVAILNIYVKGNLEFQNAK